MKRIKYYGICSVMIFMLSYSLLIIYGIDESKDQDISIIVLSFIMYILIFLLISLIHKS